MAPPSSLERPRTAEELRAAAALLPVLTLRLGDGGERESIVFRPVPAGTYRIGARGYSSEESWRIREEPRVRVVVPPVRSGEGTVFGGVGAWMAETPVTQAQFRCWGGREPSHYRGRLDHPVEQVSWNEASEFCLWASELAAEPGRLVWDERNEQLPTLGVHLPPEALWELACRAGSETDYHTGDGVAALEEAGWYNANSRGSTQPVGRQEPNALGLHDMHGNVWEWCRDVWQEQPYRTWLDGDIVGIPSAVEPRDLKNSAHRVVRGGSWGSPASLCRSAYRVRRHPGIRLWLQCFRVALLPGPGVSASGCGAPGLERAEAEGGAAAGGGTPKQRAPDDAGAGGPADPFPGLVLPARPPIP